MALMGSDERIKALAAAAATAAVGAGIYAAGAAWLRRNTRLVFPEQQAGLLHDLVMSVESWRDIRPYHLQNCGCTLCQNGESRSPAPMRHDAIYLLPKGAQPFDEGFVASTRAPEKKNSGGVGPQLSKDFICAEIPRSEFGYRPYSDLPGKPFKVYAGFHMTRQARLWRSATLDNIIAEASDRPVEVPAEAGVTFDTVFAMIIGMGASVYVYGGAIRDAVHKGAHVADDIDTLFTCTVQALVEACVARGWAEGTDFFLKRDETTGEKRYDYIAIGKGKEKFSGHTLDSNCAGEFACNCMLYDVQRKILIDASGWGIQDAARTYLRIPYDGGHITPDGKSQWEHWSENADRLPGMSSLRFFNFRSRGYAASKQTIEHIVRWAASKSVEEITPTVRTFLKRKVMKGSAAQIEAADRRLAVFRNAVLADFSATLGQAEGEAWLATAVDPVAATLRAALVGGK